MRWECDTRPPEIECCRCGKHITGVYYLTESASPAHYACLTEDERDGVEVYTDG